MELIKDQFDHLNKFYEWALTVSDPRVKDWPLMQGYEPTLALTVLYVVAVYAGKWIMRDREPIKLQSALTFYNFALIILNLHICTTLFISTYRAGYSFICQRVEYSYDPNELNIASALWWFYISKLLEMLDTIFFVLRKKNNQISFLHVYHHATMFPIWWIGVKWVAGGQSFFGAMVNSFIHVIMYTYYGVSALGPQFQKYLWWKRYLTMIQLIQFVTGIIHAAQSLIFKCDFPEWMHWALIVYAFTILLLFLNFYFHAYIKSIHKKNQDKKNGAVTHGKSEKNGEANGHIETKKTK